MKLPWPYPRIVGHRGGGTLAPENTLAGIRKAAQLAFQGVEFDVMLTADRVPLLIHDDTLDRTTDGHGAVARHAYRDIAKLDAGAWFGGTFRGERVPSFELAARLCIELGLWTNVELKPASGFEKETGSIVAAAARTLWRGVTPAPLLSSFRRDALEAARAAAPDLERGYLCDRVAPDSIETAKALACVSLHCNWKYLTRDQAGSVHDSGLGLLCYTVNDPDVAKRLFSWGVDAVFTDRLDMIAPGFS